MECSTKSANNKRDLTEKATQDIPEEEKEEESRKKTRLQEIKKPLYLRAIYPHEEGVHTIYHTWRLPSEWIQTWEESDWWKESSSFRFLREFIQDYDGNYNFNDTGDGKNFEGFHAFDDLTCNGGLVPDIDEISKAVDLKKKELTASQDHDGLLELNDIGNVLERSLMFIRVMNEIAQPVKRACDGEIIMITVPDGD